MSTLDILGRPIGRREFLKQSALVGAALSVPSLWGCRARVSQSATEPVKGVAEVDPAAVRKFAAGLRGRVVLPSDPEYEAARHVWNWAVDKHPGMIVRCAGTEDVVRAVDFARSNDLRVAVRAGGHSLAGKSVCDGGMVIDVAGMRSIHIDPVKRIAHADAGLTLREFDHATQAFGLATTLGTAPPTGIAGLTLGGGLGWLMGKYGLACDNVREVELVTADGRILTANAQKNEALYWAARGAGANFGVVTSIEYQLHPVAPVLAGPITYPPKRLREMLRFFREFTTDLPDEISVQGGINNVPGKPGPWIAACYCGDLDTGEKVLKPLRSFGPRRTEAIRPSPYVAQQALLDVPPVHLSAYVRSSFLRELSDAAIDVMVANAAQAPSTSCMFFVEEFHGAVCRVGKTETAFGRRDPGYNFGIFALWENPVEAQRTKEWGRRFWQEMQPFVHTAVYSNYLGVEEGDDRARAAYGVNYERLVTVKNRYDPTNFFRMNQNVKPRAEA